MFFVKLGGTWVSASLTNFDMRDKTGAEKLQGFCIMEIGEMNGIKKVEAEMVKSFTSRQDNNSGIELKTVKQQYSWSYS